MNLGIRRIWPDRMLHQILVLIAVASVVMMLAGAVVSYYIRQAFDTTSPVMDSHIVSVAVAKLNETPADDRQAVLSELRREVPELTIEFVDEDRLTKAGGASEGEHFGPFITGKTLLGMRIEHVIGPDERRDRGAPVLFIRMQDGNLLSVEWGFGNIPPPIFRLTGYLFYGILALTVCGLLVWAANGLVGPLKDLSVSAKSFGTTSTEPMPIREHGPKEVRTAARAFNRMQLRINEFVEKRTRMLAAISHDLRTPLTRLRLRLDLLEDSDIRDRSLEDLNIMDRQIDTALTFLRDGASSEPVLRVNIPSLLQSLADQYSDTGRPIEIRYDGKASVMARSGELTRALSNLIDNALHYADGAEIRAARTGDLVRIDIVDHGPGIAEADRARVLEPFERGDSARQLRHGAGFGLGLATSKATVEEASGSLELLETPGGGLTVRLLLPVC
ncbi:ATP-binding protein [Roseibium aggregatum]|uniref:histidine kinase n=1 Tax=Roseibium aggregatum TaxID=187304 RepID=A0A939EE99_9HYPH|nr:ATP-binding protein [Roseibium aggregatum]MBN9671627.1 HAMP domain-containing protein [Roseibium aggregatum]